MKWKHLGRLLLCLLLVCVLLVNVSPIRAEASGILAGWTFAKVAGVVAATAAGLGILSLSDQKLYETVTMLESEGYVDPDGCIEVYSLGDGIFALAEHLIERIREYFFDSRYVIDPAYGMHGTILANTRFTLPHGVEGQGTTYYATQDVTYLKYKYDYGSTAEQRTWRLGIMLFAPTEFSIYKVSGTGSTYVSKGTWSNTFMCYTRTNLGYALGYDVGSPELALFESQLADYVDITSTGLTNANDIIEYLNSIIATPPYIADGTDSGYIGSASLSLYEAYPDWTGASVGVDKDGDTIFVAPIGSTANGANLPSSLKQEDVWTGQLPIIIIDQTGTGGGSTDPSEPTEPKPLPGEGITVDTLQLLFGGLSDKIEYVAYSIQEIPEILREFMQEVKEGLERLPGQFKEWFDDIRTKLQQLVTGQITLADLLAGLFQPIRDAVVDALTYLFAPSETFIKNQVESLIAKYPTSNNLFTLGTRLGDFLLNLGQTPPVIYIDLGAAEGSLLLGGTVAFLDLTWYARYKGTVDGILGAFLWLLFAWRVWLKLPGIIGGASGTIGSILSRKEDSHDN